ncbi:MAG: TIGR01777 family oxidoreductase [Bacteroidales bacterium]|nr:TIGR01777 family oxidoreductase [Bacteroidales bacterium]
MKVKISGKNVYLGQLVSQELVNNGHSVSGIERQLLYGDNALLQESIRNCDVLINIAGAPILQPWTPRNKEKIYNSRVRVTQQMVRAINALPLKERPKRFIQTSAIGIYTPGETHSELSTRFASSYLGKLVVDWEDALENLHYSVEKTVFRLGLVLGKESKIIQLLSPLFRLGLGAKLGSGTQAFPFIHERDLTRAFLAAAEGVLPASVYNLVAPENTNNKEFSLALAAQLGKKARLTVPAFVLRLQLGRASQLLLESPQASAAKISKTGFHFQFPSLKETLEDLMPTTKMIAVLD